MPPRPGLLLTRRLPPLTEARARRDYDVVAADVDGPLSPAALRDSAQGCVGLLCTPTDRLDASAIAGLPTSLRVIATFSVGYEHLDLGAARARGLAVVHTPDVLTAATAELAMLLILAACRRSGEGERLLRCGGWTGFAPTQLLGREVTGASLGLFGMGRIGRAVASLARGFRMQVHYRNRSRLSPDLEQGARYHDDDASFLAASDILSLHAPSNDATRHWLDARRIAQLPPEAVVVNTARGALVDDDALIAALRSGRVAAAGLDVFEGEPAVNPGYLALPNTVLLPHIGSATVRTREAMGALALDGIDAVLAGRTTPHRLL